MALPQEIEVWYIIPTIRKELAKAMVGFGLKQRQVAKELGLRESAVSQYLHSKRGKDIEFEKNIKENIKKSAHNIIKKKSCVIKEIQDLLKMIKKNRTLCKVHKKYSDIEHCCGICLKE